jgi:catechol 2,3-dioxygenase-like lactoylglutathione lyase family enzyme
MMRALPIVIGVAVIVAPLHIASSQGQCKGRPAQNTPACDTTPARFPFAPTGWKTTAFDHFVMEAADYKKEAAYYATLMNWKVRSDDGKEAALDIGDVASVIIRGGYEPAVPRANPDAPAGRGRGRTPPHAVWDAFAVEIAPWDTKKVEAALKERGLDPIAVSGPDGYEAFRVKDPDGFEVEISNGAYAKTRRANLAKPGMPVAAPFENTDWKTVWLDHISFGVTNYKESVAWYQALLGWIPQGDEGSQNETWICPDCGNIIIRGGNPNNTARPMPAVRRASIGHISFGIEPFDADRVKADLEKRGGNAREDTGTVPSRDIHDPTANYKSYHTTTPNGFDLQISNATQVNRTVKW